MEDNVFRGLGVRVKLLDPDDFLKVKETLTRMGVPSTKDIPPTLFQSCHILHKRGEYAIMHYKELFVLDGKPSTLSEHDVVRRNTIVRLLNNWGLLTLVDTIPETEVSAPIRVIPYKDRLSWNLVPKYSIGKFSAFNPN